MEALRKFESGYDPIQLYFECLQFLTHEAKLLDSNLYNDWFNLLAKDLDYRVPIRITRETAAGLGYAQDSYHFYEDWPSMKARIKRLNTAYAFAEDPPSRCRRFVTNVTVEKVEDINGLLEVEVQNYFMLYRGTGESWDYDIISGMRQDRLRKVEEGWNIVKRSVYLDQTTLGTRNLAVFL